MRPPPAPSSRSPASRRTRIIRLTALLFRVLSNTVGERYGELDGVAKTRAQYVAGDHVVQKINARRRGWIPRRYVAELNSAAGQRRQSHANSAKRLKGFLRATKLIFAKRQARRSSAPIARFGRAGRDRELCSLGA